MAKNKYNLVRSEIDLGQYIKELGSNVDSYLKVQDGRGQKAFRSAYNCYGGFQAQNTSGGSSFYTNALEIYMYEVLVAME